MIGRAPGKLVLCGEHAVVHGFPAVAVAVDRGVTVRLVPPGEARRPADARLEDALGRLVPPEWDVAITSELPIGCGMGSSAAIAVAAVRAVAALHGEPLDAEATFARAMPMERVFHGNPSGLDVAVAVRAGALRFVRGDPPGIRALPLPSWPLVVLESGVAGETAAQVAAVARRRPAVDPLLGHIGALADEAVAALDDPTTLGPLLTENHRLLRAIGVSTPALDDLVALALAAGAHGAKLSGAGGGGVVLALADDTEPVLRAAAARGVRAQVVRPAPPG